MNTWQAPYGQENPPHRGTFLPWLIRIPLLGATALIMLFFIVALYLALHQLQYSNMIYPGVSAFGVNIGGMTREQATAALSQQFTYGSSAVFTFRDGERFWQKTAGELGVRFDVARTVEQAFQVGRGGTILSNLRAQGEAWLNGASVQPMVVFDESQAAAFLSQIAAEINRPMLDATLQVVGLEVRTTPSQIGRMMDVNATLGILRQSILTMTTGGELPLLITETKPTLPNVDEAAASLRTALSTPIQLYIPSDAEPSTWEASQEFIAGLLNVQRIDNGDGTARYVVSANAEPLRAFLNELAPQLRIEAKNARFTFDVNTRSIATIEDSVSGRELDIETTLKAFEASIFRPNPSDRRVALVFRQIIPTANSNATARDLGITEEIVEATTFFYGSTLERRTNIQVAASRFQGLVISPGEEFSFNRYVGDISPETGFETGLVIFGDRTIQGVGGGVCQVSTTIFQAAFFGGFPITERYAHGYRVGYYESGVAYANGQKYSAGVGMDATVYSPIIDFKFTNDTPYHLLIEVEFIPGKQSLTIRFYSTNSGRVVEKNGPNLANVKPHGPPKFTASADLRPGQERQVDYAVDGVEVRVYRTIRKDGQTLIDNEEFFSNYIPWSAQYLVAFGDPRAQ